MGYFPKKSTNHKDCNLSHCNGMNSMLETCFVCCSLLCGVFCWWNSATTHGAPKTQDRKEEEAKAGPSASNLI